jgi:hypothetical protein
MTRISSKAATMARTAMVDTAEGGRGFQVAPREQGIEAQRQGPQALAGQAAAREQALPSAGCGERKQALRRADKQTSPEALTGAAGIAEI